MQPSGYGELHRLNSDRSWNSPPRKSIHGRQDCRSARMPASSERLVHQVTIVQKRLWNMESSSVPQAGQRIFGRSLSAVVVQPTIINSRTSAVRPKHKRMAAPSHFSRVKISRSCGLASWHYKIQYLLSMAMTRLSTTEAQYNRAPGSQLRLGTCQPTCNLIYISTHWLRVLRHRFNRELSDESDVSAGRR